MFAKEVRNARERFDLLVFPQTEALWGDAAARFHAGGFDDDQPGAADRSRAEVYEVPVVGHSVVCAVLAHGRNADAIA